MIRGTSVALASGLLLLLASSPLAAVPNGPGEDAAALRPFSPAAVGSPGARTDVAVIRLDDGPWAELSGRSGAVVLADLPLPGGRSVDLELERFHVTGEGTRFVVVREDGSAETLGFDPSSVVLLRGRALGYPASRIFLSIAPGSATARIDLGPGEGRFLMTDRGSDAVPLRDGEMAVYAAREGGGMSLPVAMCGVAPDAVGAPEASAPPRDTPAPDAPPLDPRGAGPIRGLRHLQLIIDTDNEYFRLFESADAAAAYAVQLYGVISDIYIRDVNTRIEITHVRLWETPNDPYNVNDLLTRLAGQWGSGVLPGVPRDAVQLLSGRRDMNPAGQAWISALCNPGFSWAAYVLGFFVDPETPNWTSRDIYLAAHELGHSCGSQHTDVYGLDNCGVGAPPARRGSIMSYCGQAYSGGDAVYDLWFHEVTANAMRQHIFGRACIAIDCNANGVPDVQDIAAGASADVNVNGVPDECEDCNGNGVLDPIDIAGPSNDVNNNQVPDECEADCNGNGVPDSHETTVNPSIDLNRNRVPDLCEGDCDGDGVADYNEIQADMSLDLDRNVVLDECQRCLPEGPNDLVALDHAWNIYAGSLTGDGLWEFYTPTGVLMDRHGAASLPDTQDVLITPDRRVLVSSAEQNRIAAFGADGADLGTFITGGAGGLDGPACMLLTPEGTLLVVSRGNAAVLEYDAGTGAFIRTLVQPGAGGLVGPHGLAFGPSGKLFVTSSNNQVLEFDGATGGFVRVLVAAAASGGLSEPRGILFKPDGNLLVCSRQTDQIKEYDGATGAYIRKWNNNGVPGTLWLDEPWCLRLGPDGQVYASRAHAHRAGPGGDGTGELHVSDVRIFQFDVATGDFVQAYVMGDDTTLFATSGFDFMPGDHADCNRNRLPDSCDIASGVGRDLNLNGRLDACDCLADWDSDGTPNSSDISAFLTAWLGSIGGAGEHGDFDGDGAVSSADISAFLTAWLAAVSGGC